MPRPTSFSSLLHLLLGQCLELLSGSCIWHRVETKMHFYTRIFTTNFMQTKTLIKGIVSWDFGIFFLFHLTDLISFSFTFYGCFHQSWAFATFYLFANRYSATTMSIALSLLRYFSEFCNTLFAIHYSLLPLTSLMGFIVVDFLNFN
jgi:hypothetical protein